MRRGMIGLIGACILVLFGCVSARLGYLMLVEGADLAAQAQAQHSRGLDYYQYARGDILDHQGRAFTGNDEACLVILPSMLSELESSAERIAALLQLPQEAVHSRLEAGKKQQLSPYIFKTGLTNEQAEALRAAEIPGVFVLNLAARYSKTGWAAHILGQLKEGGQEGRMQGASGIELQYDADLAGRTDTRVVAQVDATGRLSSEDWQLLEPDHATRQDVRLTLDLDYQQIAERAMAEYEGACVILDPQTGDILAAVSAPGFDAYGWQAPATADVYVNKAFSFYPPASTFKILLALAAADSGLPRELAGFCCEGYTLVNEQHYLNCWKRSGHGRESLAMALANSCNPYFATLGWQLGQPRLQQYLELCGLNRQQIRGYPLADAASTFAYNAAVPGDVANVSIGENGVRLSPLLVAQLAAVCANGGYRLTPRLVEAVLDAEGQVVQSIDAVAPQRAVSEQAAYEVAAMLRLAVMRGTLATLQDCLLPAAAKTGTSEDAGVWCSGFAPYIANNSQAARWAIAVYVADGVSGGQEAAAVFKRVVDDIALLEGLAERP